MSNNNEWYHFEETDRIDSPALLVYPERVKYNIEMLKSMVRDVTHLRPHVKTHKSEEAAHLMIAAGINKFKCATIEEAEMLAISTASDVLLAYQPTHTKLLRLLALMKKYRATKFSCIVDNELSAMMISGTALEHKMNIEVYLDLNAGINRTGIRPGNEATDLFEKIDKLTGLTLKGLHAFDGHINHSDIEERIRICNQAFEPVETLREVLGKKGYGDQLKLIAGGSPTFPIHSKKEDRECSPGTFIYWDKGYSELLSGQNFLFAALVLCRVISLPGPDTLCIDLGHKSVASENPLHHRVYFVNASGLVPVSHSEEHMVVRAGADHDFQIGDILFALPWHICPTVALYQQATCIESQKISGAWDIVQRTNSLGIGKG